MAYTYEQISQAWTAVHDGVAPEAARTEERLPPPPPVDARRRAPEPHRVAVRQPERGEEDGERVPHQGRVEVLEVPRADDDEDGEDRRHTESPGGRAEGVGRDRTAGEGHGGDGTQRGQRGALV